MPRPLVFCGCAALLVTSWAAHAAEPMPVANGPLADYVARADDSYAVQERRRGRIGGTEYVELTLTSQTWRGLPWRHQLFVIKPSSLQADCTHGLLLIGGGAWRDALLEPPAEDERLPGEARLLAGVAEELATPIAVLMQVPNQPLMGGKYEDDLIAETFVNYLKSGEPDWPLLLPMVKSAVRGMDAVEQVVAREWQVKLATFTVTGASKRGWTTWLTGAVDRRATALAPMVIDMLNMPEQLPHQVATWGDTSYKIEDYTRRGLDRALASPAGRKLVDVVDPFAYRAHLTQPKLILLGTNDHYWPLDAANLYWNDLAGDKYLLYVPNNGHGLQDYGRIVAAVGALGRHVQGQEKLPQLRWKYVENGAGSLRLEVTSDPPPKSVHIWQSRSATKDFRQAVWISQPARREGEPFVFELSRPAAGYAAFLGEAEFASRANGSYRLSTNVRIVESAAAE